jgi:hypothetical protein
MEPTDLSNNFANEIHSICSFVRISITSVIMLSHFQLILPITTKKQKHINYSFPNQSAPAEPFLLPHFKQLLHLMRQ